MLSGKLSGKLKLPVVLVMNGLSFHYPYMYVRYAEFSLFEFESIDHQVQGINHLEKRIVVVKIQRRIVQTVYLYVIKLFPTIQNVAKRMAYQSLIMCYGIFIYLEVFLLSVHYSLQQHSAITSLKPLLKF